MSLFFVDCEAPFGVNAPCMGDMTEWGAVVYPEKETFHGTAPSIWQFMDFAQWVQSVNHDGRPIFVSDNPAYDWQWIHHYFCLYGIPNPFGHSARRIGDFYAGLCGDFRKSNDWKRLRITKHDHNPVNDAMGNLEAFERMLKGER